MSRVPVRLKKIPIYLSPGDSIEFDNGEVLRLEAVKHSGKAVIEITDGEDNKFRIKRKGK